MPEFEGRQTHYYGDGCPEHPAEAADHPIWCGWVNGRPGDPESRICTCRYLVDPSDSAEGAGRGCTRRSPDAQAADQ